MNCIRNTPTEPHPSMNCTFGFSMDTVECFVCQGIVSLQQPNPQSLVRPDRRDHKSWNRAFFEVINSFSCTPIRTKHEIPGDTQYSKPSHQSIFFFPTPSRQKMSTPLQTDCIPRCQCVTKSGIQCTRPAKRDGATTFALHCAQHARCKDRRLSKAKSAIRTIQRAARRSSKRRQEARAKTLLNQLAMVRQEDALKRKQR